MAYDKFVKTVKDYKIDKQKQRRSAKPITMQQNYEETKKDAL